MDGIIPNRRMAAWLLCFGLCLIVLWAPQNLPSDAGEALEIIEGELAAGGVECPLFRLTDGREATLQGFRPEGSATAGKLRLRGQWIAVSTCQQGQTFLVKDVLARGG